MRRKPRRKRKLEASRITAEKKKCVARDFVAIAMLEVSGIQSDLIFIQCPKNFILQITAETG